MEGKDSIPSFVAANYNSRPPSKFEPLAAVLCSLEDEIAALIKEVVKLRHLDVDNASSNADSPFVKHDYSDIKLMFKMYHLKKSWKEIKKRLTLNCYRQGFTALHELKILSD